MLDVESLGVGFGADGRPIILFEPHQFYKRVPPDLRLAAMRAGVAHPRARAIPYPPTQAGRYTQLAAARRVARDAALASTSWGLGQLMGFNFASCGFGSVLAMVDAMHVSEGAQLRAMVMFIELEGLAAPLRAKQWATFARRYNGPAYATNAYDVKLAAAYAKHARRRALIR